MNQSLLEHLKAARDLLSDSAAWVQDDGRRFAQNSLGLPCNPTSSMAVAFTWRGAIARNFQYLPERGEALDLLLDRFGTMNIAGGSSAMAKHHHVLTAFDQAVDEVSRKVG